MMNGYRWQGCMLAAMVLVGLGGRFLFAQEEPAELRAEVLTIEGVITRDRVNVRLKPLAEGGFLYQAFKGERVAVVGRQGEWVRIRVPATTSAWLAKDFLDRKGGTDRGVVNGDRVALRAGGGKEYDRVGLVDRGTEFIIVAEVDDYYKVRTLPSATAFVHGDYVDVAGVVPITPVAPDGEVTPDDQTQPDDAAQIPDSQPALGELGKRLAEAYQLIAQEDEKPLLNRDYTNAMSVLVDIITKAGKDRPFINLKAQSALREIWQRDRQQQEELARQRRVEEIDRKLEEIRKKWSTSQPAREESYTFSGSLELFNLTYPPATHKLVKGQRIVCLVYSSEIDLSRFEGKEVGVVGNVIPRSDIAVKLVEVTRVDELGD